METDLAATLISRAREAADAETDNEGTNICTDAELLAWLNEAYRELYDLLCESAAEQLFITTATCSPTSWTLPAGFMRLLGVDFATGEFGVGVRTAQPFNFQERNSNPIAYPVVPRYRVHAGALVWEPNDQAPHSAVTLWYVPMPGAIAADGGFSAFNGWDEYCIRYLVLHILEKQEYSTDAAQGRFARVEARIRRNAARIDGSWDTIADVRRMPDRGYYNG